MVVVPEVTVDIRIRRLDFPGGKIVYIMTADDQFIAGGWDEIQDYLTKRLNINTSLGLPVANINLGV